MAGKTENIVSLASQTCTQREGVPEYFMRKGTIYGRRKRLRSQDLCPTGEEIRGDGNDGHCRRHGLRTPESNAILGSFLALIRVHSGCSLQMLSLVSDPMPNIIHPSPTPDASHIRFPPRKLRRPVCGPLPGRTMNLVSVSSFVHTDLSS